MDIRVQCDIQNKRHVNYSHLLYKDLPSVSSLCILPRLVLFVLFVRFTLILHIYTVPPHKNIRLHKTSRLHFLTGSFKNTACVTTVIRLKTSVLLYCILIFCLCLISVFYDYESHLDFACRNKQLQLSTVYCTFIAIASTIFSIYTISTQSYLNVSKYPNLQISKFNLSLS